MISICIPVYKPEEQLFELLKTFERLLNIPYEFLILETLENHQVSDLESRLKDQFKSINLVYSTVAKKDFAHGVSRNVLFSMSQGDWIIFTTQDINLLRLGNVAKLITRLEHHGISAISAIHAPPGRAFRPLFTKMFDSLLATDFQKVMPSEFPWWSNNFAIYSAKALRTLPFYQAEFGEDLLWAQLATSLGFKLEVTDQVIISHFNKEPISSAYKRGHLEGKSLYEKNIIVHQPNSKPRPIRHFLHRLAVLFKYDVLKNSPCVLTQEFHVYLQDIAQTAGREVAYRKRFRAGAINK